MSKYWPEQELRSRKVPDQIIYAQNDYPLYTQEYLKTIIYIRPTNRYIHIKTQFSSIVDQRNIMTMAIANYYVGFDQNERPYFINPFTMNLSKWKRINIDHITFFYPPKHQFDRKKADSLIVSVRDLEKQWNLQPRNIKYYFADDLDELFVMMGFDMAISMGNTAKPSGKADDIDNQVFCGGLGENYFHEVVHLYLNRLFPRSPLVEGLAAMYGGSMGHNVKWHIKRVNEYLDNHPEANLSNIDDFWYTDTYTNPGSAIQGMLCQRIYAKEGVAGLKRLMTYETVKDAFIKEFNLNEKDLSAFIRDMISKSASRE